MKLCCSKQQPGGWNTTPRMLVINRMSVYLCYGSYDFPSWTAASSVTSSKGILLWWARSERICFLKLSSITPSGMMRPEFLVHSFFAQKHAIFLPPCWTIAVHNRAAGRIGVESSRSKPRKQSCSFTRSTLLNGHQDAVSALVSLGDWLISGSWDSSIKVWATDTWHCVRTLSDHAGSIK